MLDQLSPVAPARVRAVLLPIGQIKRARFLSFVERLQPENVVRLGDISPDGRPNRTMFSPLAFPAGMIVYDLNTFFPPPSHVALSPFELYREPLVIIAIADGAELDRVQYRNPRRSLNGSGPPRPEHNLRELEQDLEELRDRYPKALVHQVLVFDYVHPPSTGAIPEGLVAVPRAAECKITTLKTIMCDLSSMLLAEMTTLAKSLQALPTIDSPSQARQHSGGTWQGGQGDSWRNSQNSLPNENSRSGSPAGSTDRSYVRMSMPAQLRRADSSTSSPAGRPSTPQNGVKSDQHATFDQIVGPGTEDSRSSPKAVPARLAGAETRDTSRDRVSVQGFGPGSISERSRNIGKGRIGIVIGSLYLQAGRWGDALRELSEAGTIAKYNLDHLWHGKALDYIVVGMLMLAWSGMEVSIPQLCYVTTEKATQVQMEGESKTTESNRLASLQNLAALLPELLDRILNLYDRSANNTGEALPQFPSSESVLRFSKLLATLHLAGGVLEDNVLRNIVLSTPLKHSSNLLTPRLSIQPRRTEVVTTLFRAFPTFTSQETLSLVDRTIILSGIASIFGMLGYYRKKAMVVRELVSVLIPGLVQARLKGAAEMGVHPAAGLASLNSINGSTNGAGALDLGESDIETGIDSFLNLLSQTYGVVSFEEGVRRSDSHDDSDDAVVARIVQNASTRVFGGQKLKLDVLRSCIKLSEALPDFHGVLRFTADLLRTAGSGIAPGPRSDDASPSMSRDEQVRLATNISRTLGAAKNLGVKDLEAEYWDEFLVRGIELEALPSTRIPLPHKKAELPGAAAVATAGEKNPFIYNPFLRAPDTAAVDHLLVAGEGAVFRVTLQNPYDFDVELESIKLESDGTEFTSHLQKTTIGPYRTQILSVSGTPQSAGQLRITGCRIKVKGCRERRFPIFAESWSPQRTIKIKAIGVNALFKPRERPTSTDSKGFITAPAMKPPKPTFLGLNVIDKQPVLVVKSNSLSQNAIMILEGERQRFTVTLQNLSKETPVDLLLFSFKDSTQAPLQAAMANRDTSPAELYEYELIFARKQALRWIPKDDEKPYIEPGGIATFELEVLGKPGLTTATIHIDYAYLGVAPSDVQDKFHTRQINLPLTVTVNASLELTRMDILPLTGNIPESIWAITENRDSTNIINPEEHCLLLLDLRNSWPSHLHVHLDILEGGTIDEEILPGNTSRLMFPIPRIHHPDPHASIPTLDPSRQRQFIVSAGKVSADSERASREAFWYREEILKTLHGTWRTKTGPSRSGKIELRGIRLTQRMIDAIKVPDVGIDLEVKGGMIDESGQQIFTDSFAELRIRIRNRTTEPIFPLLRIQPSIRHLSHSQALDLSRKLIWNGVLQQTLDPIPGEGLSEVSIGMTALCRGEFEISASVEEARLKDPPLEEGNAGNTRPRANTRQMMDAVLGAKERRIWHSREPCLVFVRDADTDDDDDDQ